MGTGREIAFLIVETLGGLYVAICLLRVLLQASRADYYNPVSQFMVQMTAAPVSLLRRIIPVFGRFDGAALLWALIAEVLVIEVLALVGMGGLLSPMRVLAWGILGLLSLTLTIYFWGLLIVIIMSFLTILGGMRLSHPILDLVNQLMRPVMEPVSRILPPMGGIDLSPILLFLGIRVMQVIINNLAGQVGLGMQAAQLVPGI